MRLQEIADALNGTGGVRVAQLDWWFTSPAPEAVRRQGVEMITLAGTITAALEA